MVHSTTRFFRSIGVGLWLTPLLLIAACSRPADTGPVSGPMVAELAIPAEVVLVSLSVGGDTYTELHDGSGSVAFELEGVPLGSTLFTARGFDAEVDGVLLYIGSTTVDVGIDTASVDLTMARAISGVSLTVTSDEAMSSDEVVTATISGFTQALVVGPGGTSASGSLVGVPTGRGLTLTVESRLAGELVRQGSTALDLSEGVEVVSLSLTTLTGAASPPDAPVISGAPSDAEVGESISITVDVTDVDGDLASVSVQWGDGATDGASVAGASDSAEFDHAYTSTGSQTITVTATDASGLTSQTSTQLEVVASADATDIDVVVDVGPGLSHVSITATAVPGDADEVVAHVTLSDPAESYDLALAPQGAGEWTASMALQQNVAYDLQFIATIGGAPSTGSSYSFTPDAAEFVVSEPFGGGSGVNSPPQADDDVVSTGQDTAVQIDVLANDGDPDGDPLTIVGVTSPTSGTASLDGDVIVYTPSAGFTGSDTFDYTISDGSDTDTATVTVTVASTAVAIVPVGVVCPDQPVGVGDVCQVSIELVNHDGDFRGFQFEFVFSNETYSTNTFSAAAGDLTSGFNVSAGSSGAGGISQSTASGSGEILVLSVTKEVLGSDEIVLDEALLVQPAPSGDGVIEVSVGGGSLALP